jgi:hypothetical protein
MSVEEQRPPHQEQQHHHQFGRVSMQDDLIHFLEVKTQEMSTTRRFFAEKTKRDAAKLAAVCQAVDELERQQQQYIRNIAPWIRKLKRQDELL